MRVEAFLWSGVTFYFLMMGLIYMAVGGEPAGVVALLMASGLGGLIAGFAWNFGRRHGTRIEDLKDSDAPDATGVVGVYPTASLRPIALAFGTTLLVLGVPIGSWMSMIGAAIIASQILLLVHDTDD
ncbi:MAG: hypothetical protein DRJ50_07200 [Actinobacteria bacterium]|nr:MAG: hypothetical protein DRJ50_07200 [Actinomycetota bacterium]